MITTIYNTLRKPDNEPLRDVKVSAVLSWDTSISSTIQNDNEDFAVDSEAMARTNLDGFWELELVSNESLYPANSVYVITETVTSSNINIYYVSVPSDSSPIWIGDILVSKPQWES